MKRCAEDPQKRLGKVTFNLPIRLSCIQLDLASQNKCSHIVEESGVWCVDYTRVADPGLHTFVRPVGQEFHSYANQPQRAQFLRHFEGSCVTASLAKPI